MTKDNHSEDNNKKPTIYEGTIANKDLKEIKSEPSNKVKIYKGTIGSNKLTEIREDPINNPDCGCGTDYPFFNNIQTFNPPNIYNPPKDILNVIKNQKKDDVGLSKADKNVLYPTIIDHLDLLWKKGGYSVENVKEWGFQKSEINEILNKADISITEKKQKETKRRVVVILFMRYFTQNGIIKKLDEMREDSPTEYETLKDIIKIVQNELENSMGKKLSDLHLESEKIRENQKELLQKTKYIQKEELIKNFNNKNVKINHLFMVKKDISKESFKETSNLNGFRLKGEKEILTNKKVLQPNVEIDAPNINIPHFREEVNKELRKICCSINCTKENKDFILSKSIEILDEFILRARNKEFTIPKNANLKKIALTIIYTITISNDNMPKISVPRPVYQYYQRYFKKLYPRINFLFNSPSHNFKGIRNLISLYFFEFLKDKNIETSELVNCFKRNVRADNLPSLIKREEIDLLIKMINKNQDIFIKYFSDLVETLKQLIKSCKIHKKIGASLVIKHVADLLYNKGINLFQKSTVFYQTLLEIYDYLRKCYPHFFPIRLRTKKYLSDKEKFEKINDYRKIIAFRLKLYLIKNIYNGKYFKDGKGKCPKCSEEGFLINSDIYRLKTLEFHHSSDDKEELFSSEKLYAKFIEDQSNPNCLEDLIKSAESEKVILICRSHHFLLHDKFFGYFEYLINYNNLFSFSPELIHLLVRVSVDNFYLTKDSNIVDKINIRRYIVRYIKKRYIIENIYGEVCHICGEFSIKNHLSAFIFHHRDKNKKELLASDLYNKYSCSKIVSILEKEEGGYICANCHSLFHYKFNHLLNEIFEDESIAGKIFKDYNNAIKNFTCINNNHSIIKEPLKKSIVIDESIERYLIALYNLTELDYEVSIKKLISYLGINSRSYSNIHKFFKRKWNFLSSYVNILDGENLTSTKFILTKEGKELIKLIYHFKDYYKSLS